MKYQILKVKDWLRFKHPDYEGFRKHVEIWEREGYPHGFRDLINLAKQYNIAPKFKNGELVFD